MKILPALKRASCSVLSAFLFVLLFIQFMTTWQELSTIRHELHRAKMYQMEKREIFWGGNEKMFQLKSPIHALIWKARN